LAQADPGFRNGYRPVTVKTTTGSVVLQRPKLRGTAGRFTSGLFGPHPSRTDALEALVIAGFVRGLSVRDVEATLTDALGAAATLSKSTVSRVCQAIKAEFDTWSRRRLDEVVLDYLFLDASHFRMHAGARAEPVLAAWGITTEGKPALIALAAANAESTDAWADFLSDLYQRGLRSPLMIISDGAAGLIAATEQIYSRSLRQRCLIHVARNVLAKVPQHAQAQVKADYWAIFDPARKRSTWPRSTSTASPPSTPAPTPPRSGASSPTATNSPPSCACLASTGGACVTPTSSNAASARPAAESRSSAGSPARPAAYHWSGRYSTGPAATGVASP
jgi:transposase-like protein